MKKILKTLLLLVVMTGVWCMSMPSASAETPAEVEAQSVVSGIPSGQTGRALPEKLDIAIERNYAKQFTYDSVYETMPSVTAPYATGALTDEYLQSGFAHFNYIRYVAGLPSGTLVPEWNELSQYGAVLLAANDMLTHYPAKPADMQDDFYEMGRETTASSNISYSYGYGPQNFLIFSMTGCMSDNSSSNMPMLGHRRWLLNPLVNMQIGFGEAVAERGSRYVVTKVFNSGSSWDKTYVDYQYVAWPASGNFPSELITMQDPWSVTLNPEEYERPNINQISVTITRSSDGASWTLDQSDYTTSPKNTAPYFNVNTSNYGVANCIIFHPGQKNWGTDSFDGTYNVTISGITKKGGGNVTLSYDVDFFDVSSVTLPEYSFDVVTNGAGTVSGIPESVTAGSNVTFSVVPDDGYETASVRINGEAQPIQTSYTIERITQDTEITVLFQDASTGFISDGVLFYSIGTDGELTVAGLVNESMSGALTIPSEYAGLPVTAIGENAFEASAITSVRLPDTIKFIGSNAFRSSSITGKMTIPSSVTAIEDYAFSYMRSVTEFDMEENENYLCMDGVLFGKDANGTPSTLMNYPLASDRHAYAVPGDVTLLFCTSFADAKNLKALYVPGYQVRAMTYTFYGCNLNLFGRTGTQLQEQLPDIPGTVSFSDIEKAPILALEYGMVRYINLGSSSVTPNLVMAGYGDAGKMTGIRHFEDVTVDENSVVFFDAQKFEAPFIKFFLLDKELVPLQGAIISAEH